MAKPNRHPAAQPIIEVRIIEQPVPAAIQNIHHEHPAASHKSKPQQPKPQPAPTAPQENPHSGQNPQNVITAAPGAVSPGGFTVPQSAHPSADNSSPTGSYNGKGKSGGNIYANSGARAIIRPMPQIPDDLREEAFNFAALARFHVAADGSAQVELARPSPNPSLNRILLDTLKKWRFMPAIKNGKPVASTEEIVINIQVK